MRNLIVVILPILAFLIFSGCSSTENPTTPQNTPRSSEEIESTDLNSSFEFTDSNRYLWGWYKVSIDPHTYEFEIIPVRNTSTHWNILKWLEQGPCTTCFGLEGITPSGYGTLFVNVRVTHPFLNPNLTGFDVRGIPMFNASATFTESGLIYSDRTLGDGELVNADGYTTLYNPSTAGSGPGGLQGYIKGKLASEEFPDTVLNGFMRHISDDPANTRNAFFSGDAVIVKYEIDMPDGPFIFGYAVDASWAKAETLPVTDPMNDFGIDANMIEPWMIDVTEDPVSDGLSDVGGATLLTIDVYDWSGKDSSSAPVLECSALFEGTLTAAHKADFPDHRQYQVMVQNDKLAPAGEYHCLISSEDNDNATAPDWLDLTAYQVYTFSVIENPPPVALASVENNSVGLKEEAHFMDEGSYDPDGGPIIEYAWDWENDGHFDANGTDVYHAWGSKGTYNVQLKVMDDEGKCSLLDEPIEVIVGADIPFDLVDITPFPLSFAAIDVCVEGDYAYVTSLLHGIFIFDITDKSNPQLAKKVNSPGRTDDIIVLNGYAYILDPGGSLMIADVDPLDTASVITTIEVGDSPSDMAIAGGYAYVMAGSNLNVVDIDPPESAFIENSVYASNASKCIAVSGDYAYTAGWNKLRVWDISTPALLNEIITIEVEGSGKSIQLLNSTLYIGTAANTLLIYDINSPESPTFVKSVDTGNDVNDLSIKNGYAYLATGADVLVVDIEPAESAEIINTIEIYGCASGIFTSGDYLFIADNRSMTIQDISAPGSEFETGKILGCGIYDVRKLTYADGYVYASEGTYAGSGGELYIIDVDPVESAYMVSVLDLPGGSRDVGIYENYALVTGHSGTAVLQFIDISNPELPELVSSLPTMSGAPEDIVVDGEYAYISGGSLCIVDLEPPESAYVVSKVKLNPEAALGLDVAGGYALVTEQDYLTIVDVYPPETAFLFDTVIMEGAAYDVAIEGGFAYTVDGDTFGIFDIDPIEDIVMVKGSNIPGWGRGVRCVGGYAYVAEWNLKIYDVDPYEETSVVAGIVTEKKTVDVEVNGDYAYLANIDIGVRIIRLWE